MIWTEKDLGGLVRTLFAGKISEALAMPETQRRRRMRMMREKVRENSIFRWAGKILQELARV